MLAVPNRADHFKIANESLLQSADTDADFNKIMETMVPGFRRVKGAKILSKGISPGKKVTWHDVPGTDTLQLVWRYQNEQSKGPQWNALWQKLFHPGNKVGFADGKR